MLPKQAQSISLALLLFSVAADARKHPKHRTDDALRSQQEWQIKINIRKFDIDSLMKSAGDLFSFLASTENRTGFEVHVQRSDDGTIPFFVSQLAVLDTKGRDILAHKCSLKYDEMFYPPTSDLRTYIETPSKMGPPHDASLGFKCEHPDEASSKLTTASRLDDLKQSGWRHKFKIEKNMHLCDHTTWESSAKIWKHKYKNKKSFSHAYPDAMTAALAFCDELFPRACQEMNVSKNSQWFTFARTSLEVQQKGAEAIVVEFKLVSKAVQLYVNGLGISTALEVRADMEEGVATVHSAEFSWKLKEQDTTLNATTMVMSHKLQDIIKSSVWWLQDECEEYDPRLPHTTSSKRLPRRADGVGETDGGMAWLGMLSASVCLLLALSCTAWLARSRWSKETGQQLHEPLTDHGF